MYTILVSVIQKVGDNAYDEVKVEKDSVWIPRAVIRNVDIADILSVRTKLERDDLW
jgi:hypothetical protein